MAAAELETEKIRPRLVVLLHWNDTENALAAINAAGAGGDIATVVLAMPDTMGRQLTEDLKTVVKTIQQQDIAVLIWNQSQLVGRTGADGLLIDGTAVSSADVSAACDSLRPDRIVGVLAPFSRHEAMILAESDCDFILFGRPGSDTQAEAHPKVLDLAAWWAELFEIPVVALAGTSLDSIEILTTAGVDFILADRLVWQDSQPDQAVASINRAIDEAFANG